MYLSFCYAFRIVLTCEYLLTWFIKLSFIASTLLVFCKNESMGITLRRSYLPKQVNIHNLRLRGDCAVGYNKTHIFSLLQLTTVCGTICQKTDQIKSYTNSLFEEQRSSSGGKKSDLFLANFTCSYDRKNTAGSLNFLPARRSLLVTRSKYMRNHILIIKG